MVIISTRGSGFCVFSLEGLGLCSVFFVSCFVLFVIVFSCVITSEYLDYPFISFSISFTSLIIYLFIFYLPVCLLFHISLFPFIHMLFTATYVYNFATSSLEKKSSKQGHTQAQRPLLRIRLPSRHQLRKYLNKERIQQPPHHLSSKV